MQRYVCPPREDFSSLRTPLTSGELQVFEFFDKHLSPEWAIYIQPNLNGLEPDFVLLNPKVGLAVFEVKDWDLKNPNFPYRIEFDAQGHPCLLAGKGARREGDNPVRKARLYQREIRELYCPRLGKKARGHAAVSAGVIFPNTLGKAARELFKPWTQHHKISDRNLRISGQEDLALGRIQDVFPDGPRDESPMMSEDLSNDFRSWLEEPEYKREQRRPLKLTSRQSELVTTRTQTGYRRVKGSAGSGKSIALAARAATLAQEGKRVLVVCYNITLLNYLRDLCARWTRDKSRSQAVNKITWIHFHGWCKRVCLEVGAEDAYNDFWRRRLKDDDSESKASRRPGTEEDLFDHELADLVQEAIRAGKDTIKHYDAVLVDEGQDFLPGWWNALRKTCKPDGEMLLFSDSTQDIYGKSGNWTEDSVRGCGFPGGVPYSLEGSYRLPTLLLPLLCDFAKQFLPSHLVDPPTEPPDLLEGPCKLRWRQTDQANLLSATFSAALEILTAGNDEIIPVPDVTILVTNKKDGTLLADLLERKNIRTITTFDPDSRREKSAKCAFYKGSARAKLSTIHSFKGIESRALVLCLARSSRAENALAYTAMSRLKRSEAPDRGSYLTVVSSRPELLAHGKKWPSFEFFKQEA